MNLRIGIITFSLLLVLTETLSSQVAINKINPFPLHRVCEFKKDSIIIYTFNPLKCPLRLEVTFQNHSIQKQIESISKKTLQINEPIVYKIFCNDSIPCNKKPKFKITIAYGDLNDKITQEKYSLPLPKRFITRIIQGYNGIFSHRSNKMNTYAIDFKMLINDTICATADGFVVGKIDEYVEGGSNIKLIDYGNKITIFHPRSNTFSEYYHLGTKGSLVQLGDSVIQGQPIGLAGNTGYSTEPHLHFVILVPDDSDLGFKSIPTKFIEGYNGFDLKNESIVIKMNNY